MAQEFRPLVITNGVQKRLPDNDALEIGPGGLVAQNDGNTVKMIIGADDNVASKPIELKGNAHFLRDVKIQGELEVVGDSLLTETFVSKSIFQQTVQFGDGAIDGTNVQDKAEFAATIQMHTGHSEGSYLKTSAGPLALDAENALLDMDGNSVELRSDSTLQIDSEDASHLKMAANDPSLKILEINASNLDAGGSADLVMGAGNSVEITGGESSFFKATTGEMRVQAVGGSVHLEGATAAAMYAPMIVERATGGSFNVLSSASPVPLVSAIGQLGLASDEKMQLKAGAELSAQSAASYVEVFARPAEDPTQTWADERVAGNLLLDASGDLRGKADADITLDADGLVSIEATGNSDFTVTGDGKALALAATGVSSYITGHATNAISMRGEVAVQAFTNNVQDATRAQFKLDSVGESLLYSKEGQPLTLKAQGAAELTAEGKDVFANAGAGYMQLKAGTPAVQQPPQTAGNITLWADQDFRAAVDNAIALDSVDASYWEVSNGNLELKSAQRKLRLSTGAHAPTQGETDLDIVLASDLNIIADAKNMFFLHSGSDLNMDVGGALTATADGLTKFVAKASMEADIEGGLTITVDTDGAGVPGDVLLDANYDTNKAEGGKVSIFAGNNDNGYFRVAAGERAPGTWLAPNAGEIELRSQMDMRLRAGTDLRIEVGSSSDVILDDSSAGVFDETNEDGHARIRNVKDPTHAQDVVTKKYMEENGGGTVKLTAHEALAKGDLVALNVSGKVEKASAAPNAGDYVFGIATHAAAQADDEILVRMLGKFNTGIAVGSNAGELDFAATDIGKPLYLDASASGGLTLSAPQNEGEMVQRVGFYLGQDAVDSKAVVLMMIGEPVIL